MSGEKRKRLRSSPLHVLLTPEEHKEFDDACKAHNVLARELVMKAVRELGNPESVAEQLKSLRDSVAKLTKVVQQLENDNSHEMLRALAVARG